MHFCQVNWFRLSALITSPLAVVTSPWDFLAYTIQLFVKGSANCTTTWKSVMLSFLFDLSLGEWISLSFWGFFLHLWNFYFPLTFRRGSFLFVCLRYTLYLDNWDFSRVECLPFLNIQQECFIAQMHTYSFLLKSNTSLFVSQSKQTEISQKVRNGRILFSPLKLSNCFPSQ